MPYLDYLESWMVPFGFKRDFLGLLDVVCGQHELRWPRVHSNLIHFDIKNSDNNDMPSSFGSGGRLGCHSTDGRQAQALLRHLQVHEAKLDVGSHRASKIYGSLGFEEMRDVFDLVFDRSWSIKMFHYTLPPLEIVFLVCVCECRPTDSHRNYGKKPEAFQYLKMCAHTTELFHYFKPDDIQ